MSDKSSPSWPTVLAWTHINTSADRYARWCGIATEVNGTEPNRNHAIIDMADKLRIWFSGDVPAIESDTFRQMLAWSLSQIQWDIVAAMLIDGDKLTAEKV